MAVHRYWRAVALEAYGAGDLELSCFHLSDAAGTRVDAPATLTASIAPATGAVASLQDDDLTTAARWPVQSVASLSLNWDFGGSPVDMADIRLAGNSEVRFPLIAKIQYSDDAVAWVDSVTFSGITWPGIGTKTSSVSGAILCNTVKGRVISTSPITIGTGPTIIYGIPQVIELVNLTVQSGAVRDYITGVLGTGRGKVSGVVREKGTPNTPVYRKVRLIRERDGLVIREIWSDPITGAYSFNFIDELQSWAVQAHDHTFAFRDQIASNLTLANGGVELMP